MFASLKDELKAEVDEVWAEPLRHFPLVLSQADPTRQISEFTALLQTGDRDVESVSVNRKSGTRAGIMAGGGVLRIDRAAHPDLSIKAGDKVLAMDRPGEPVFEVQAVDDRSRLRLICELGDA